MFTLFHSVLLCVTFLPLYQTITFFALPSNVTLSGSYLKLSCSSENQIFPIIWSHNGNDIAENCRFYIENHRYICNRLNDVYEIYIPNVKFEDRGNWSCAHGPKSQKAINMMSWPLLQQTTQLPVYEHVNLSCRNFCVKWTEVNASV
ncbi:unnamed protein product [Schistosoma mattheei]|uniref:Ig-like domain-containing protein n=1 Tax=Schistosoma mattheei TaxID=31246 RepID=A0AA85B711_9TREM|nr:unnamed protein product [Schistosoma mattheei]